MELRRRGNRSDNSRQMETFDVLENTGSYGKDETVKNQKCLSAVHALFGVLAMFAILNSFVYYMNNRLPTAASTAETNSTDDFVAKRAMATLTELGNLGARPVGSYENEKLAVGLLTSEIRGIMDDVDNRNPIEMRVQKVNGSYTVNKKKWLITMNYEDLQNVVVRINPKRGGANDAVLLNCHFDSVPAGPGVSDDGVNCALMVEVLRVLAKSPVLRRPVIFLFNGGEEVGLLASHGFVTQHPWARDAKYVINMDSCGAGGRAIMFQTTKRDSYLVDLYARTVPHPYGQVIGEEIFQADVIPSDTDFRIFRDYGNMTGLDLAHYKNGYVYHTMYDNLDRVQLPVLQNAGENLLELTKAVSVHNATATNQRSRYVFFDVLGVYMVSYTELSGTVANFMIVLVSVFSIFLSLRFTTVGMDRREYSMHLLSAVFYPVFTVLASTLSCVLVAFVLDRLGCSMSWYTNKINLTVYYATATLAVLCVTVFYPKNESRTSADWTITLLNGCQFFFTALLFLITMAGMRSGYLFAVIVLFPSVASCVLGLLSMNRTAKLLWIAVYAASLLVPITFLFYLTQMFTSLFAPITGRFGPTVNPDYIVGGLISLSTFATVGYLTPIVTLVRKPGLLLAGIAGLVLLSVAAILWSPLGFPYSDGAHAAYPTKERFDLLHTRRTFYHGPSGGAVRHNDSGYLIMNWDRNSPRIVSEYVPEMMNAVPVDSDCAAELMCGSPITTKQAFQASWLPAERPPALASGDAANTVAVVRNLSDRRRRIEFNVTGPERAFVYISPYPGTKLESWSFTRTPNVTTRWQENDVYVVKYVRGGEGKSWKFWLEQSSGHGFDVKTLNVTVASNWVIHKNLVLNDEFRKLTDSFPNWAHVNYAVAAVDAYVY